MASELEVILGDFVMATDGANTRTGITWLDHAFMTGTCLLTASINATTKTFRQKDHNTLDHKKTSTLLANDLYGSESSRVHKRSFKPTIIIIAKLEDVKTQVDTP